jgi:hypothetical protein
MTPLRFATLHLHQVGRGLSPPSCRTCTAYKENARRVPGVSSSIKNHFSRRVCRAPSGSAPSARNQRSAPSPGRP